MRSSGVVRYGRGIRVRRIIGVEGPQAYAALPIAREMGGDHALMSTCVILVPVPPDDSQASPPLESRERAAYHRWLAACT